MKKLIMILAVTLAISATAFAQNDSVYGEVETIEEAIEGAVEHLDFPFQNVSKSFSSGSSSKYETFNIREVRNFLIPLVAITLSLLLPILIVLIVFIFRYKNKKNQYAVAEKAIAAGIPIPQGLFDNKSETEKSILAKGIKNTFMGLGLVIFLWFLTGEIGVAGIGIMITFIGVGQIVIHLTARPKTEERPCRGRVEVMESDTITDTDMNK